MEKNQGSLLEGKSHYSLINPKPKGYPVRELKGQLSLEFMIVFVGLLLVVGSITYALYDEARADADRLNKLAEAREAAAALANALNSLYAGGPGSKQTIDYWLPEGVVEIYAHVDGDGVTTADWNVSSNGRIDVQVLLDFDGNGEWDNTRSSTVVVDTLLPSRWYENGDRRDNGWVIENCIGIQDWTLQFDSTCRTRHRVTLEYKFEPVLAADELLDEEQLSDGKEFKLKTTLFGIELEVEAENKGSTIKAYLEFGGQRDEDEASDFTLGPLTSDNVTTRVTVGEGWVRVWYSATLTEFPYPKRILITDNMLERA
jgi:uncharacterized protein (UPF0333 family)